MNSTALSGTKHLLPWRDSSWCLHSPSHSREKQLFIWGFVYFIFFISVLLIWRQTTTTLNSRHFMPRVFFFQVPLFSPDVINLCPLHVINLTVLYLMLLLCVWSHLLFVGALSSPSLGSQKATAAGCPPYTCVCWKSPPVSSDCCGFSVKSWPHDIKRVERTVVLKLRVINKTEIKTWILCHFESLQRETTFSKQHWCLHRSTHT